MTTDTGLVKTGLVLFFLALLTGLMLAAGPAFIDNPRGVLAGHVEGTLNGMFLVLVGLFFGRVKLSAALTKACRALLIYGAFANWIFTTLAGVVGASQGAPIAGAGHHASATMEQFVLVGFVSVALAMISAVGLLIAGIRTGEA